MDLFTRLFTVIGSAATPALYTAAQQAAIRLYWDAKKTPNPWDDILAQSFCTMLGVTEIPNIEEPKPEQPKP